jgi:peptide/nickel transport system ATP-binding protein
MSSLDPVYTIGAQMTEAFRAHRDLSRAQAKELAVGWLREVGIPMPETRMKSYPHELSGGTRQRVSIATALALDPPLLVADEPTSALDVTIQAQILRLLADLIREHAGAVILITHDLGVVAQLCNRLAVMYAGQVIEEADVHALFAEPAHPYTKALLAAHPGRATPGERLATIPGRVPDPGNLPTGCSFRPRCPSAVPASESPPPWVQVGDRHHVRCVLYDANR